MHRPFLVAPLLAIALARSAGADFLGFSATSTVIEGEFDSYLVLEVYARFDDPTDRVLNIFDVQAGLARPGLPGSKVPLFQASDPIEEYPASMLPMGFLPPGEQWVFDSYITIGARQGNFLNGTVADPDFDDTTFTENSRIDSAGWYNLPPTNAFGLAGSELRVFLGQFTVLAADYESGLHLDFSATIGYANSGALSFAADVGQFDYRASGPGPYVNDRIDSDACGDLVFVNPASRDVASWLMQGFERKATALNGLQFESGWQYVGMGDLDGNGTTDLVWRESITGKIHAWLLENGALLQSVPISGPLASNWSVLGIGDISGDGRGDLVLRDALSGDIEGWIMDGGMRLEVGTIGSGSGLIAQGLGDLDGDGMHDIVWRTSTGSPRIWLLDGLAIRDSGSVVGLTTSVPNAWKISGIGDLDGDSKADIVWRHASGAVSGWLMDGKSRSGWAKIQGAVGWKWKIGALCDLDGDGRRDLVWRHALTGDVRGWLMNGLSRSTVGFIRNASPSWSLVDP
ncbi:MAG: FG-GAP repeat domain-containing protein [bacterium]